MSVISKRKKWINKKKRISFKIRKKLQYQRLVVFRSNKNIFTQLVDDINNRTILSVSSIDKTLKGDIDKAKNKIEKSIIVGNAVAAKIKKENIGQIIFDRNGYKYHGRVKALGDAIRTKEVII